MLALGLWACGGVEDQPTGVGPGEGEVEDGFTGVVGGQEVTFRSAIYGVTLNCWAMESTRPDLMITLHFSEREEACAQPAGYPSYHSDWPGLEVDFLRINLGEEAVTGYARHLAGEEYLYYEGILNLVGANLSGVPEWCEDMMEGSPWDSISGELSGLLDVGFKDDATSASSLGGIQGEFVARRCTELDSFIGPMP
jgi:hypothetical protein